MTITYYCLRPLNDSAFVSLFVTRLLTFEKKVTAFAFDSQLGIRFPLSISTKRMFINFASRSDSRLYSQRW